MEYRKLEEIIQFNPTETIKKGTISKKISMDKLDNFRKYVNSFDLEEYKGGTKFKNGDTLLARITPCLENGKTAKVSILEENEVGFGSTEYIVMRKKNNMSDEDFIYYLAISPEFRNIAIKSMTGTSGRQRVQLDVLKNTEMLLPPYEEQKKIGKILSLLDKKIELNNQINNNLHELVNCIYKELFSNKIYKIERLGEHAKCILGGTPSRSNSEYWNGKINWINSGEVNKFRILEPSEQITELGLKKSSTKLLPKNTTVLAITGATLGKVSRLEIDSCANQSVVGIVANKDLTNNYIYLSILNNIENIVRNQTGGAQQHINKGNIEDFKIYIPTESELKIFEERVTPLFNKISINCKENIVLEQLRDILLPKLMNGEIDLGKIEI